MEVGGKDIITHPLTLTPVRLVRDAREKRRATLNHWTVNVKLRREQAVSPRTACQKPHRAGHSGWAAVHKPLIIPEKYMSVSEVAKNTGSGLLSSGRMSHGQMSHPSPSLPRLKNISAGSVMTR